MNVGMKYWLYAALFFFCWAWAFGDNLCERTKAALESGDTSANTFYNAACCHSLKGETDIAFTMLDKALAAGYHDHDWAEKDTDLDSLKKDPRWATFIKACVAADEAYLATVNRELALMYRVDQSNRQVENIDWSVVSVQDAKHRERVAELLAEGKLKTADDYFHAAMIFQHGSQSKDYKLAHDLAKKAYELDPKKGSAKWLSCASEDRWLQSLGKPQIWGTQYMKTGDEWTMEPFDRSAKTDEERKAMGVPTLAESLKNLERYRASN